MLESDEDVPETSWDNYSPYNFKILKTTLEFRCSCELPDLVTGYHFGYNCVSGVFEDYREEKGASFT